MYVYVVNVLWRYLKKPLQSVQMNLFIHNEQVSLLFIIITEKLKTVYTRQQQ